MIERVYLLVLVLIFLSNMLDDYYISKFMSIVLISAISFFLSHFIEFNVSFIIAFALTSLITIRNIVKRGFKIDKDNESVFLISFAYFLFLRSLLPDIHYAEKFMDVGFLNSVLNAKSFPPNDPFLSGKKIDFYYYFGYVIAATISKMSLMPVEYAYNVSMAFISAISVSLLYGFMKDVGIGKIGLIPLFLGSLYSFYELMNDLISRRLPGFLFYWNSTRVIPDKTFKYVITEFPYFSFIHADLHAHVIAIPLKILFIAVLYRVYKDGKLSIAVPLLNFALFATNSWDAPAFFILSSLILLIKGRKNFPHIIASAALILIFKLEMNVKVPVFLTHEFSEHLPFLLFWGIFIFLLYYKYLDEIKERPIFILSAIPAIISPAFLFLPLIFYALRRREFDDILVIFASIFIIICEFVAIDCRMNTYFKFYLLSWVLLLYPIAYSLKDLYERKRAVALILIALMLVYPVVATPVRHYKAELTLDGLNFMKETFPGDYYAIKWLYGKNVVIVERAGGSYTYSGRIAVFSGNQDVISWFNHELHWRNNSKEIIQRINDVRKIYTGSCEQVLKIARKYNVSYIIYGRYERELYKESNFSCLKLVFKKYGTEIYEVPVSYGR